MFTKKCLVCDKEFAKPYVCSNKDWEKRKACSRICENIRRKEIHFSPATEFTKERHYVPSTAIKKGQRLAPQTEFKKGHKTWNKGRPWTSEERANIAASLPRRFGKNAGNWKGGVTKTSAAIRTMREYKAWRKAVFERDDYTCQQCNQRGGKLHVDHIKPFYKIIEENDIHTPGDARACTELWNMKNGRTLCIPCHRQTGTYLVNQHTK